MQQTCKLCNRRDKFNFHVPDDIWESVVPPHLQNRVICLDCFDSLAHSRKIDYACSLTNLYFVGEQAIFVFRAVSAYPKSSDED